MRGPLRHRQISAAVEEACILTRSGLFRTTLGAAALARAALASTRGALEDRLAGGSLLHKAFAVVPAGVPASTVATRAAALAIVTPTSTSAPTIPVAAVPIVLIAALAIAPTIALAAVCRSVGVFTAQAFGESERILRLVEGGVGISVAVVDPGSGRLGVRRQDHL